LISILGVLEVYVRYHEIEGIDDMQNVGSVGWID
jgi:hypothetical protein